MLTPCPLACDLGSLDREEVRQLLKMCSSSSTVSDNELDTAMKELDADSFGEVDLEGFKQYFSDKVTCCAIMQHNHRSHLDSCWDVMLWRLLFII